MALMADIDDSLKKFPLLSLQAGECLLTQGGSPAGIYFLNSGAVRISKDGYQVAVSGERGAVFGEMSVLLDKPHSASVECLEDSTFYHVEHPAEYLADQPAVLWHIAQILGLRLYNLDQYLVDVKKQYQGHDHLDMVDDVLGTLLNQQQTRPVQREDSKRDTPDY
jgi:CRP-like cAMP-binding protein